MLSSEPAGAIRGIVHATATISKPSLLAAVTRSIIEKMCDAQESIKASKEWFMACEPHAAGMAAQMAEFLSSAPTHEQRLHVLYLANDVLLKG